MVAAALALGYSAARPDRPQHRLGLDGIRRQPPGLLGLRPIHGAEIDLADGRHLTLLVQDAEGWSNLCRILTRAHAHTRERPGPPALPFVELDTVLSMPAAWSA